MKRTNSLKNRRVARKATAIFAEKIRKETGLEPMRKSPDPKTGRVTPKGYFMFDADTGRGLEKQHEK